MEPATISIPTSLQADKNVCAEPSFKNAHVRLLMNSDEGTSHWTEITDQLPRPADLNNGVITFQATHFTRYVKNDPKTFFFLIFFYLFIATHL